MLMPRDLNYGAPPRYRALVDDSQLKRKERYWVPNPLNSVELIIEIEERLDIIFLSCESSTNAQIERGARFPSRSSLREQ